MATQAQINANRRNAQRSTGPATPAGKAAASRNSISHGLWARDCVIAGEDLAEFDAFQTQLLAELRPVGVLQETVAARIVHLWWKLRRLPRLERAGVQRLIAERPEPESPADTSDLIAADIMRPRSIMRTLQTHETRLTSSLRAAMAELRELQAKAEEDEVDEFWDQMGAEDDVENQRNEPNSAVSAAAVKVSAKLPPAVSIPPRPPQVARALSNAVSAAMTGLAPAVV